MTVVEGRRAPRGAAEHIQALWLAVADRAGAGIGIVKGTAEVDAWT
ncbi:MAG TPA: hypothetical protein VK837_06625 [Longimicrobiales bacterium]|nr:hypothetical protein [Longimicrobiales bacterium]